MAGLVGYESSDEEEEVALPQAQPEPKPLKPIQDTTNARDGGLDVPESTAPSTAPAQKQDEHPAPLIGPQIGPSVEPGPSFPPLEEAPLDDDNDDDNDDDKASGSVPPLPPGSPYTATRSLLRDLTLPPLPNTSIPPSPPGSPPPATSAKFSRFLELKKGGTHFNTRVAQSPALRNPALMDKLLAFVELASPADQYRTTLGPDLWDPAAFPRYAYKEQLRQAQVEGEKTRARSKGAPVEFVAGSASDTKDAQQSATTQGGSVPRAAPGKRKTRFET
ncbi:hypothetical protein AAE478_000086 [Parahypoxylon ruwenzoriense]